MNEKMINILQNILFLTMIMWTLTMATLMAIALLKWIYNL